MSAHTRFDRPSSSLVLRALLRRARGVLCASLGLAVVAHVCLALIARTAEQQRAAKPLTTHFVKRAPRLTKPLELRKRPRPKRRAIRREMVSVKADLGRVERTSGWEPVQALRGLARPTSGVERRAMPGRAPLEPRTLAAAVEGRMAPKEQLSMALELVDVETLDTGEYHAMVIVDPTDRANVKGFFHVGLAYSINSPKDYGVGKRSGSIWYATQAIPHLVDAVNRYTQIRTDIVGSYTLDSAELFKTPLIFMMTRTQYELTPSEAENFGRYLLSGGFAFVEDTDWLHGGMSDRALRKVLRDALGAQGYPFGSAWDFERLAPDAPLYHCFFDFDGPPPGEDNWNYGGGNWQRGEAPYEYLEGIAIEGRLLVLYSMKGLATCWSEWGHGIIYEGKKNLDPTRQLQLGVNVVVFALTQEGSITNRVMDAVGGF